MFGSAFIIFAYRSLKLTDILIVFVTLNVCLRLFMVIPVPNRR